MFHELRFGQLNLMMMATKLARHLLRVGGLAKLVLPEHNRKRFNRLRRRLAG